MNLSPEPLSVREWPFYCATFHLAVRWYANHSSQELFYFLTAMRPEWPYQSNDPGNWLEWLELADAANRQSDPGDPMFDRQFDIATKYVAKWASRDLASRPSVRALAAVMSGDDSTARDLKSFWTQQVRRTAAEPRAMGGAYSFSEPHADAGA
jgi:hypothetical protein